MVTSLLSARCAIPNYFTRAAYQRSLTTHRTAVVVGATSGIGQACAHRLAEQGFLVIAVGRDNATTTSSSSSSSPDAPSERAKTVVESLTRASTNAASQLLEHDDNNNNKSTNSPDSPLPPPTHEFIACNAFSLRDVQLAAKTILAKHDKIDALIMTQGMATTQGFTPTAEGNDEKLTLHYYSRMAWAWLLLPALKKSTMPAVVLSILSGGVHSPYNNYAQDPSLKNSYSIKNAADAAGYYNDLGLDHLARHCNNDDDNKKIAFCHASPGFVNTSWGKEFHPLLRSMVRLFQPLGRNPADCAEYMLGATVLARDAGDDIPHNHIDDANESGGVYIIGQNGEPKHLTKQHTPEARAFIWKHTVEVLHKAGIDIPS